MRIRIDVGEGHIEIQAGVRDEFETLLELLHNALEGIKEKQP